ncbi:MAG: REP-associated tyrosine transposase [Opitutales bacterium]
MSYDHAKGHEALRRGRYSQAGAEYFLTLNTEERGAGLYDAKVAGAILAEATAMSDDGTWILRSAVVMPDHVHCLTVLGDRLPLGKVLQRLKAKTSSALRTQDVAWERDFYDRRLRPNDDRMAVFHYIYLNPYRAGLISRTERWPYYHCSEEDWTWFSEQLDQERPAPEWLR